ncbi:MAG: restriction endonuclease subunit S [Prevotella sp.]|nr:restriction endonuclease subunit S [Prevotella sp.]
MVEWKELGEVASYYRGVTYNKKQEVSLNSGGTKILRANNITLGTNSINYDDIKEIDSSVRIKNYQWLYPNDILICAGSGSKEHVGKVAFIDKQIGYAYGGFMGKIVTASSLNPRFLFHIICSSLFKDYLKVALNSTTINNLNAEIVNCFIIPIPSLSEQNRIVGILDTFTDSIENLKQQIAQRRKQYEHYREKLLDLEGKPKEDIKKFGDYCVMIKGNGVQKTDFVDEGIGCIHYGQIYTHYGSFTYTTNKFVSKEVFEKAKKASKGDIIMTDTSENVEDICKSVAYLGEDDIAVSNHALIIKHEQNPKFLSYSTLTSSFFNQKRKVVFGVKVSGIKPDHLAQIQIYLPVIEEQNRIVSILDTFEASISNLEAQLEQRQKQYEYYRNKLLSFEKEEQ